MPVLTYRVVAEITVPVDDDTDLDEQDQANRAAFDGSLQLASNFDENCTVTVTDVERTN